MEFPRYTWARSIYGVVGHAMTIDHYGRSPSRNHFTAFGVLESVGLWITY